MNNDDVQPIYFQKQVHSENNQNRILEKESLDILKLKFHEPIEMEENVEISQKELIANQQSRYSKNTNQSSLINLFKIQSRIKKIVQQFLTRNLLRRVALLNKNKVYYINDKSVIVDNYSIDVDNIKQVQSNKKIDLYQQKVLSGYSEFSDDLFAIYNECKKLIFEKLMSILEIFPLFQPHSKFVLVWNIINAFLKIFLVFLYSFSQFFHFQIYDCSSSRLFSFLYFLILILLFFDIFVNLNKISIQKGVFIQDKKKIAKNYIRKWLFHDLLQITPIIMTLKIILSDCNANKQNIVFNFSFFINFFIYLMIYNFYDSVYQLEQQLKLTFQMKLSIKLGRLIFFLFLLSHLVGCTLKFVNDFGFQYLQMEKTWMGELIYEKWFIQYIYSFYWATTTMITVGYGDLTPKNPLEIVAITFIQFLGCGVFGFMINQIGSIFSDIKKSNSEFQIEQEILATYLSSKKFPNELIQRVSANLEYIHQFNNKIKQSQEQEILKRISSKLQQEIINKLNKQILEKIPILNQQFSKQSTEKINFQEFFSTPSEIIIQSTKLFYLENGTVDVYMKSQSEVDDLEEIKMLKVCSLNAPQVFGEYGFFTGENDRQTIYKSVGYCSLYFICRQDFQQILKNHSSDFERFKEIQDDLIYNQNYHRIELPCLACQNISDHLINNCPCIHLKLSKYSLIIKTMNKKQQRKKVQRQISVKSKHSLLKIKQLNLLVQDIRRKLQVHYLGSDLEIENSQFQLFFDTKKSFGKSINVLFKIFF